MTRRRLDRTPRGRTHVLVARTGECWCGHWKWVDVYDFDFDSEEEFLELLASGEEHDQMVADFESHVTYKIASDRRAT